MMENGGCKHEGSMGNDKTNEFKHVAEGTRHSLGIDAHGRVFSWGKSNSLGQLGRSTNEIPAKNAGEVNIPIRSASKVYVSIGNDSDSGHSAVIDSDGMLWMAGCDRWQQLGLGSSKGGSTGYTWKNGKLWQENFVQSSHVIDLINEQRRKANQEIGIRDVALGGDHSLILASNGDVYAFGKGGDGQLGLVGKPFVSAPIRSTKLSERGVSAVCAIKACSITLDEKALIKSKAGKCKNLSLIDKEIAKCIARAERNNLFQK